MEQPVAEEPGESASPLGARHELAIPPAELVRRVPLSPAIGPHILSDDEIRRAYRLASSLAISGLFKDVHNAEQAFGKILIGRDIGLSPTQALMTLDIVEGAIFMRGVLLAAFVRKSAKYDYKTIERTHTRCCLLFLGYPRDEHEDGLVRHGGQWWEVLSEEEFTIEDARRAQLLKPDKLKSGWMAHPKNMLFWRCISNAVKMLAPDLLGGVPVYTEADDIPHRAQLGEGTGDGKALGLDLGPDVKAVIERAAELGVHDLADKAMVEQLLGDQPQGKIQEWVKAARARLDAVPVDAEVVGGEPEPQPDVEAMRSRADDLREAANSADSRGDVQRADDLRDEADALDAAIEAAQNPDQGALL